MNISIIIPCFNEVLTIEKVISNVKNYVKSYDYEIIIVDDGSTDGSSNLLEKLKKKIIINFHLKLSELILIQEKEKQFKQV